MTGPIGQLLRAIVSGSSAERAVEATLADWRHERAAAVTRRQRLVVDTKANAALMRTVVRAGVSELPAALRSSLILRLAIITVALVAWTIWNTGLPGDQRFFLVAPSAKAWLLAASSMAVRIAVLFPILVFVAEATGRRSRSTPTMGSLVLLVGSFLMLTLVIVPAGQLFIRYESWRYFANASQPAPDLGATWLPLPTLLATFAAVAALVMLFVLANVIRKVGGVVGWSVGVGPVIGLVAGLAVLRPVVTSTELRVAVMLASPLAITAVLIWSAARLSRIASARSASVPPNPQIAK